MKNLSKIAFASLLALLLTTIQPQPTKPIIGDSPTPVAKKTSPVAALAAPQIAAAEPLEEVYVPPPAPVLPVAPPRAAVSGCGDNTYANYIYMHESGCRTDAINPIGACGIGQALPCSKMGCDLSDYACENAFFTGYAMNRYGSWEAAYNFWLNNHWW